MQRTELSVGGMTCVNCEERIRRAVEKVDGVAACVAEYDTGRVRVSFDPARVSRERIVASIEEEGYPLIPDSPRKRAKGSQPRLIGGFSPLQLAGAAVLLLALLLGLRATGVFARIPEVTAGMGYGLLFVIGVLTSFHCVAMCGGINLSQSVNRGSGESSVAERLGPGLLYNAGRVISYTVVGGVVGAVGSVIGFSQTAQGVVVAAAGIFMVIMGVTMLELFPGLRKLVPHMPRAARRLISRVEGPQKNGSSRRFVVGLLNGLMPCGPLQSMQLYALGTGSAAAGALSMFLFSMGTVPLMLGFGAVASLLSGKAHARVLGVSALIVAFMGVAMIGRGINLTGFSPRLGPVATAGAAQSRANGVAAATGARSANGARVATIRDGVQYVETTLHANSYEPIVVQAGIPLKWTVKASAASINGCNGTMTVPSYGIQKRLAPGNNLIEFTPGKPGNVRYTCWMGMITSVISVVPDLAAVASEEVASTATAGSAGNPSGGQAPFGGGLVPAPMGSISAERIGRAVVSGSVQGVVVVAASSGFSPEVLVMQRGVPMLWEFQTKGLTGDQKLTVDVPAYDTQLELDSEGVKVQLVPDADFWMRLSGAEHYAFIKVVDDLSAVSDKTIRAEVEAFSAKSGGR